MPRITLAMPVYNGEAFIETAIKSILKQSFSDLELVITDNASVDGTEAICRRLAEADSRIRYYRNEKNLGAAANYNLGYEYARGEFFKWCAHDDYISENYVEAAVAALDRDREAIMAYGRSEMIDAMGRPAEAESAVLEGLDNPDAAWRFLKVVRTGGSCSAIFGVFRRASLALSLLHRPYYSSDRALLAEMALLGRFILVPGIVFYNRAHPNRSMSLTDRVARMMWQNAASGKKIALEHLPLLRQISQVAWRHRDKVPVIRTAPHLLAWTLTPRQAGAYGIEVVSIFAPGLANAARQMARGEARKPSSPPEVVPVLKSRYDTDHK
jgi:glycosyltransferase involved in cell wall biosynthesis